MHMAECRRGTVTAAGRRRTMAAGWAFGMLCGLALWLGPALASAATSAQDPKHFIVDVVAISGEEFVVKDEAGTEAKIHVGTDTEKFGHIQPGDRIDAWVLPNGHAKTIMILRSAAYLQLEQNHGQQTKPESGPAPDPSRR